MIDSLTSSIATVLNAKRDSTFQKDVKSNLSEIKDIIHKVAEALYEMHTLFNESNSKNEDFQSETLNSLLDVYSEIVNKSSDNSERPNLSDLGSEIAANMVNANKSGDKDAAVFESMNKSLQSLVKLNQTQVTQEESLGKVLNKVEKTIGAPEKKTKMVDTSAGAKSDIGVGAPVIDPTKIDMGLVAKSMAQSAASALNPAKLVKAFFSELLPYVIIFGLLLYGFITGYLNGDVYDFILILGGTILAAFLLYIAYQYIKANILFAFKMLCEMIKLNLAFAVQALQIVAIGLIVVAFLLVAGLMLILFGAAFLLIAKGLAILIETITDSIIKFLSAAIEIVASIPAMIGTMFGKMMRAIFDGGSDNNSKGLEELVKSSIIPKMDDMITAIKGINVDVNVDDKNNSLDSILTSGFTEIVNAISNISKKLEDISPASKDITIDFNDGMLFGYFGSISDNIKTIVDLVSNIVDNNAKKESEIIKQITNSTLEQNTKAIMNGYQITDGTMVLRDGYTAYATLDEEEKGTDLTQIVEKLDIIISHLGGIYDVESANSNAKADTSWWASLTENDK